MKFPRNTRLLRSPFEIAPFAAVFFSTGDFSDARRAFADTRPAVAIADRQRFARDGQTDRSRRR